jgi:hypothetical protein
MSVVERDWVSVAPDKDKRTTLANAVVNFRVPWNAGKLSSGYTAGGVFSSAKLHRAS